MSLPPDGSNPSRRLIAQVEELQARVKNAEARRLADLASATDRRVLKAADAIHRLVRRGSSRLVRRSEGETPGTPDPGLPELSAPPLSQTEAEHEARYRAAIAAGQSESGSKPTIEFAVWTDDLDEGRGDLFVAAGLGQALSHQGYDCRYTPRERWGELAGDSDVIVVMTHLTDPALLPPQPLLVAWVRNQTDEWLASAKMALFDVIACSSNATADAVRSVVDVPVFVIPIGVDLDLFAGSGDDTEAVRDPLKVVSTISQWSGRRAGLAAVAELPVGKFDISAYGFVDAAERTNLGSVYQGPCSFFGLPSVYRSASIVIDDFNATTAPYGNVNSRVFEALACGAFVVTSSANGLADLGLADVAVYGPGTSLGELLQSLLAEPSALADRAAALQLHVRENHGWSARADLFDQMVRRQL